MLYVDIPDSREYIALVEARADACVTIYLQTTPVTREIETARIELGNLRREAQKQLEEAGFDKRRLASLVDQIDGLIDDGPFWAHQANSLAIFVTPDRIRTYRLANKLTSMVQVADRFHLKPLLRARTFAHSAFVLALSENAVRLIEVHADMAAVPVTVPDMPKDAASAVGKSTLNDRSFSGRVHGSEGQNVWFEQYSRKVDAALRPILAGRETPLILAATGRLASVFRQISSFPQMLEDTISDSPDRLTEAELAERARPILDKVYAAKIAEIHDRFEERLGDRRAITDISDVARAATFGMVDTLLVDIDSTVPGFVDDDTGAVTFVEVDDAKAYGVVDEIAGRALVSGATVLAVRRDDIPRKGDVAAILRYAP